MEDGKKKIFIYELPDVTDEWVSMEEDLGSLLSEALPRCRVRPVWCWAHLLYHGRRLVSRTFPLPEWVWEALTRDPSIEKIAHQTLPTNTLPVTSIRKSEDPSALILSSYKTRKITWKSFDLRLLSRLSPEALGIVLQHHGCDNSFLLKSDVPTDIHFDQYAEDALQGCDGFHLWRVAVLVHSGAKLQLSRILEELSQGARENILDYLVTSDIKTPDTGTVVYTVRTIWITSVYSQWECTWTFGPDLSISNREDLAEQMRSVIEEGSGFLRTQVFPRYIQH